MEFDQWTAVWGATARSAGSQLGPHWIAFPAGLLAANLVVGLLSYLAQLGVAVVERSLETITLPPGLLIGLTWLVNQGRFSRMCAWGKVSPSRRRAARRSGAPQRSVPLIQGVEVCSPSAKRVCRDAGPESRHTLPVASSWSPSCTGGMITGRLCFNVCSAPCLCSS